MFAPSRAPAGLVLAVMDGSKCFQFRRSAFRASRAADVDAAILVPGVHVASARLSVHSIHDQTLRHSQALSVETSADGDDSTVSLPVSELMVERGGHGTGFNHYFQCFVYVLLLPRFHRLQLLNHHLVN